MITDYLWCEIEDFDGDDMWFQQVGAKYHSLRATLDVLRGKFRVWIRKLKSCIKYFPFIFIFSFTFSNFGNDASGIFHIFLIHHECGVLKTMWKDQNKKGSGDWSHGLEVYGYFTEIDQYCCKFYCRTTYNDGALSCTMKKRSSFFPELRKTF